MLAAIQAKQAGRGDALPPTPVKAASPARPAGGLKRAGPPEPGSPSKRVHFDAGVAAPGRIHAGTRPRGGAAAAAASAPSTAVGPAASVASQARLFAGYTFSLTQASGGGGSGAVASASREASPPLVAAPRLVEYDKEGLQRRIVAHGGTVVDELDPQLQAAALAAKANPRVFVVSDVARKTKKYLVALAAGIPCVSYRWILECLHQVGGADESARMTVAVR